MNKLLELQIIDIRMNKNSHVNKKIRDLSLFHVYISNKCLSFDVIFQLGLDRLFWDIYLYELCTAFRRRKFIPEICSSALVTLCIPRSRQTFA